jgi:hypothetical protein
MANSGADVITFCHIFREVHVEAVRLHSAQTLRMALRGLVEGRRLTELFPDYQQMRDQPNLLMQRLKAASKEELARYQEIIGESLADIPKQFEMTREISPRLQTCYKALFFFVRAFQDTIYAVLNDGQRGSMQGAVSNPNNPIAKLLSALLPEYLPWFEQWRRMRDNVKRGASFSISGPDEDLGIGFNYIDDNTGGLVVGSGGRVRLGDVVRALEMSRRILELTLERLSKGQAT